MEVVSKYLRNRIAAIIDLLEKPRSKYEPGTFHKLRLEIKKLDALFDLLSFCTHQFKQKKAFKPFKIIFRHAGKVREIQIEQAMLKNYLSTDSYRNYRNELKKHRANEQNQYFSIKKEKIAKIRKKYLAVIPFLSHVNNKKVNRYLDERRRKIKKLINQNKAQNLQIHDIRKQLKKYYYNRNFLYKGKKNKLNVQCDDLQVLLGKWHDNQVVIRHLNNSIDKKMINSKEISRIEKIKRKILSNSKMYLSKIKRNIPKSEFIVGNKRGYRRNNIKLN